jgi:hypothetical protein
LDQRIEKSWRARSQALLTLMNSGVGFLIGYLSTGWWFNACTPSANTRWTLFWSGLAGTAALATIYFLSAYRGIYAKKAERKITIPIS